MGPPMYQGQGSKINFIIFSFFTKLIKLIHAERYNCYTTVIFESEKSKDFYRKGYTIRHQNS